MPKTIGILEGTQKWNALKLKFIVLRLLPRSVAITFIALHNMHCDRQFMNDIVGYRLTQHSLNSSPQNWILI